MKHRRAQIGNYLRWTLPVGLLAELALAGCGSVEVMESTPSQAELVQATFEAPPDGQYECGFPLGSTVYGRPRGLTLKGDGGFEFFHHEGPAEREEGEWTFAGDLHQIGFYGETILDYGYYDLGASQLILFLKPAANGQVYTVHCLRAEVEQGSQH